MTFRDISLHLQGYHVQPRDGTHFVRLFADAQFYSLPKLISQLYDESIFMSIGHREFQIPREIFSDPGNSPNFFSLGFAIFFSNKDDLFPGLDREGLIRPPSILPPSVPNRSADTFAEILHLLRGYPVNIRHEAHRAELLRDCRYFNFKGLEQKLIPHSISFNQARRRDEIVLRLEDILKSGISVVPDATLAAAAAADAGSPAAAVSPITGSVPPPDLSAGTSGSPPTVSPGWVHYARPFVDDRPYELVLEIGGERTRLHVTANSGPAAAASPFAFRAEFFRDTRARVARLFEVICTKLNLPPTTQPLGLLMASGGASSQPATPGNTPLSEDLVRVIVEQESAITLDGRPWSAFSSATADADAEDDLAAVTPATTPAANHQTLQASSAPLTVDRSPNITYPAAPGASPGSRPSKRRRTEPIAGAGGDEQCWIVKTGQWRLRIQQGVRNGKSAVECVLVAVRIDAFSSERARNERRPFLNGS